MSVINLTGGLGNGLPSSAEGRTFKLVKEIDFAVALVEKESALAAGDIINVFNIPAGTIVQFAQIMPVKDNAVSPASAIELDLGFTSSPESDPDNFVDGYDATVNTAHGVPILTVAGYALIDTTLDLEIQALTGVLSTGKVMITALLVDLAVTEALKAGLIA
jgi:hypothetical protein